MPVLLETLDQKIATTLSDWNLYTTLIAVSIVAFLAYPILYPSEPDTHPLLLARQASAAPVRNKNESAVYRCPEIPHGYPLKTGLNVKNPGEPRWKSGKDGDLRDVWREVVQGGKVGADGKEVPTGAVLSVFGKEKVVEHDLKVLSGQINVLGRYWRETGEGRVAVYLPNNVEYLLSIFGGFGDFLFFFSFESVGWSDANVFLQPALSMVLRRFCCRIIFLRHRSLSCLTWWKLIRWSAKLVLCLLTKSPASARIYA